MKNLPLWGVVIFCIGLTLRIFHFPDHDKVMLIGILATLFLHLIHYLVLRPGFGQLLAGWVLIAWMTFLLFVVEFYPLSIILLLISISLTGLMIRFRKRGVRTFPLYVPVLAGIFSLVLTLTPSHERYYWLNIHFNPFTRADPNTWDRYSWVLYRDGEYEKAEAANERALSLLDERRDKYRIEVLEAHRERIRMRDWEAYH